MILVVIPMVIPAQAGMMQMNLQDLMAALVDMILPILMQLNSAVLVVADQLVAVLL